MKKLNDKQLLCLVKTDIEAFNDYRKKNPDQKIEFTKLEDINFKNLNVIKNQGGITELLIMYKR